MKIGFIGLGNMGSAIVKGIHKQRVEGIELLGYNPHQEKAVQLEQQCGLQVCDSDETVAEQSDVLVLAVKPQMTECVLPLLKAADGKLIISVIAGKSLANLESAFPHSAVVRIMPNINARVGGSITGICFGRFVTEKQKQLTGQILSGIGEYIEIEERFAGIFSCIGGAAPAFTYTYINAVADSALKEGMPKPLALEIAAQSVLGSARMILESADHPKALADQVCSPGGTTIEGMMKLSELGFEHAVHEVIHAVIEKDKKL